MINICVARKRLLLDDHALVDYMGETQKPVEMRNLFRTYGAGSKIQTYDLRITSALLYQLSYTGTNFVEDRMGIEPMTCGLKARYSSSELPVQK